MGMKDRQYDPIRITVDETVNRANEGIMQMDDNRVNILLALSKEKMIPTQNNETFLRTRLFLQIMLGPLGLIY